MESPVRWEPHAGFGERPGETDQQQCRHRAPGRLNPVGAPILFPGRAPKSWRLMSGRSDRPGLGCSPHRWPLRPRRTPPL